MDSLENVSLFFNHKLTGADFGSQKAWFEVRNEDEDNNSRPLEIEITFDLMIGADGAHSAVRYHMMKFTRMDYQQEYIDTLWCEFRIEPRETKSGDGSSAKFRISQSHLHIWPGKEFMFIAIPSEVCISHSTLFDRFRNFVILSLLLDKLLVDLPPFLRRTAHSRALSFSQAKSFSIWKAIHLALFRLSSRNISPECWISFQDKN